MASHVRRSASGIHQFPILSDRDALQLLYAEHTLRTIADMVGCSHQTVSNALATHAIPRRPPRPRRQRPRELNDRDWVDQHYVTERRTIEEIAASLGCLTSPVRTALRHYGIPTQSPRLTDANWLRARHEGELWTARRIAREVGCSTATVYWALQRLGIPTRAQSES